MNSPPLVRPQVPEMEYRKAMANLRKSLMDELLPYHELKEALSVLSGRIDAVLARDLQVRHGEREVIFRSPLVS